MQRTRNSTGSVAGGAAPLRTRGRGYRRVFGRGAGGGERFIVGLALMVPLAVISLVLNQWPGSSLAASGGPQQAQAGMAVMGKRPISSNPAPPPTLVAPTATPKPAVAAVAELSVAQPTATPQKGGTYLVQPGDELKGIAATYNVSIWKIIAVNNIPNPDSLKIGQELRIPTE